MECSSQQKCHAWASVKEIEEWFFGNMIQVHLPIIKNYNLKTQYNNYIYYGKQ
jgi:hypothetical protein